LWHYVTDSDEDVASARLKQHWYGYEGPRRPAPPPLSAAPPALSKDAFMVRELHRELARADFQGKSLLGAPGLVDPRPVGPRRRIPLRRSRAGSAPALATV
jgi:hypothetical protein